MKHIYEMEKYQRTNIGKTLFKVFPSLAKVMKFYEHYTTAPLKIKKVNFVINTYCFILSIYISKNIRTVVIL